MNLFAKTEGWTEGEEERGGGGRGGGGREERGGGREGGRIDVITNNARTCI